MRTFTYFNNNFDKLPFRGTLVKSNWLYLNKVNKIINKFFNWNSNLLDKCSREHDFWITFECTGTLLVQCFLQAFFTRKSKVIQQL